MQKTFYNKYLFNIILFLIFVSAVIISAHGDGMTGRTLKNGNGCTCHNENFSPDVSVSISGPDSLAIGQSGTYTVTIQGGPLSAGGTNIAASSGNLLPVSGDLRKENDELTHVAPKSPISGSVTFQFTYTAPNTLGQQTLFANGNSVNLDGKNTGDKWNFAPNKTIMIKQPTSVDNENLRSSSFELKQNYPNPFNPSTIISWQSSVSSRQTLKVYDVLGNEVAVLLDEWKEAGSHSVSFDASGLPSGVYLYRLQSGNYIETKKMTFLR
jgi:hypothetical protein